MSSVDKIKVNGSTYDISSSSNGTMNGFTSNDAASPTVWSDVNIIASSDTNSTIFSKVTTMIKNVRWLYSKLGTTDFFCHWSVHCHWCSVCSADWSW